MSVALENIFDDPLEDPQPDNALPRSFIETNNEEEDTDEDTLNRPSKRRRSSLFLDGSDDEEEGVKSKRSNVQTLSERPDIDSLFADLNEPGPSKASTSSRPFNLDALRREARDRIEKEAPSSSLPQYAIQSSSPARDALDKTGEKSLAIGKGENEASKRRVLPKMDTERLVDKNGFPALMQLSKEFKPKGKGHELADLNSLFTVYQFWVHRLYPRTQFIDTVNRIEKLCHSKRMNARLSVWRDEAHGTLHGMNLDGNDVDLGSDDDKEKNEEEDIFGPLRVNNASSSSRAPSEAPPPSSASERAEPKRAVVTAMEEDDPFDIDAILAEEEEMKRTNVAMSSHNKSTNSDTTGVSLSKQPGSSTSRLKAAKEDEFMFDEDEEAIWAEMHDIMGDNLKASVSASVSQKQKLPESNNNNDNSKSIVSDYDDEDAWDVLNDIERDRE